MKKHYLFLLALALPQLVFADTCPTVNELKKHPLLEWRVFDSEDGRPLSNLQANLFKREAHEFVLAEWTDAEHKNGTIHCYYRNADGGNLEAYLARNNFIPEANNKAWYKVTGAMQCAKNREKCQFTTLKPKHLASR